MSRGHFRVVSCKCISPSKKCLKSNGAPERYATSIITALLAVKSLTTCGLLKWCYLSKREKFCYLAPLTKGHNHLQNISGCFFDLNACFVVVSVCLGKIPILKRIESKGLEPPTCISWKSCAVRALAAQEPIKLVLTLIPLFVSKKESKTMCKHQSFQSLQVLFHHNFPLLRDWCLK